MFLNKLETRYYLHHFYLLSYCLLYMRVLFCNSTSTVTRIRVFYLAACLAVVYLGSSASQSVQWYVVLLTHTGI
jgi:hypothetical protein